MKKYKFLPAFTAGILFLLLIVAFGGADGRQLPDLSTEVMISGQRCGKLLSIRSGCPVMVLALVVASALSISEGFCKGITRNPLSNWR